MNVCCSNGLYGVVDIALHCRLLIIIIHSEIIRRINIAKYGKCRVNKMLMALEKLNEQLNCPICLGPYTNPRILQCFHVYCQDCLIKLVKRGDGGNHTLKCPECRRAIPVPANGVAGFQAAYRTTELQEIHKALTVAPKEEVKYCIVHEGRELELYCETCEKLICLRCAYRGEQHHSHDHQDVDEAFEAFKEHILSKLDGPRDKLNSLLKGIDKVQQSPGASPTLNERETVLGEVKAKLTNAQDKLKQLFKLAKVNRHSRKEEVLLKKSKLLSGLSSIEEAVQSSTLKLQELRMMVSIAVPPFM